MLVSYVYVDSLMQATPVGLLYKPRERDAIPIIHSLSDRVQRFRQRQMPEITAYTSTAIANTVTRAETSRWLQEVAAASEIPHLPCDAYIIEQFCLMH